MDILIFGDSITQGFYDTEKGGWVSRLASHANTKVLQSNFKTDTSVFNLGVSGDNTIGLMQRFDSETESRTDGDCTIIITIGVNDSQFVVATGQNEVPTDVFKENIKWLIQQAKKRCKHIVVVGIAPIDEKKLQPIPWKTTHAYADVHIRAYNEILKDLCGQFDLRYISMDDVFSDTIDSLVDGIHPNARGHEEMGNRVIRALEAENML